MAKFYDVTVRFPESTLNKDVLRWLEQRPGGEVQDFGAVNEHSLIDTAPKSGAPMRPRLQRAAPPTNGSGKVVIPTFKPRSKATQVVLQHMASASDPVKTREVKALLKARRMAPLHANNILSDLYRNKIIRRIKPGLYSMR